jgi:hypothetical protein
MSVKSELADPLVGGFKDSFRLAIDISRSVASAVGAFAHHATSQPEQNRDAQGAASENKRETQSQR